MEGRNIVMTDNNETENSTENGSEVEHFPVEPRYHPVNRLVRSVYDLLASSKLAMLLLVSILVSCLYGAVIYREQQLSMEKIFSTMWFNGLLVLLVVNTACCFFGRMWGRKITVISFGMILFHLSFVSMFLAIVFNSLFSFDGTLRLTEGETLSNRDPQSYDTAHPGLLFSYSRLKGETALLRVHRGYKIGGEDKLIAYDIAVADGSSTKKGTIYINNKFDYQSVEYIRDREGYSLLTIVNDRQGRELYGAFLPLQSYKQKDDTFIYGTGSVAGPAELEFPPEKGRGLFGLQISYVTDSQKDRSGRVRFKVWPVMKAGAGDTVRDGSAMHGAGGAGGHNGGPMPDGGASHSAAGGAMHAGSLPEGSGHSGATSTNGAMAGAKRTGPPIADGSVNIAEKFVFGDHQLFVPEVRYWVAMNVRYNPGKPLVLASLWVGLSGMIITTVGRMLPKRRRVTLSE